MKFSGILRKHLTYVSTPFQNKAITSRCVLLWTANLGAANRLVPVVDGEIKRAILQGFIGIDDWSRYRQTKERFMHNVVMFGVSGISGFINELCMTTN